MSTVTSSSPGKLMLFGEHAVLHGHPCIVTAIDQRMQCTVMSLGERVLECVLPEVGIDHYRKPIARLGDGEMPKGVRFVEIALRNFLHKHPMRGGVRIETSSAFTSTFGFGSSSASAVGVAATLEALIGLQLPRREIFDIAYKTVLDVQGKGSGFDVAAAVYGGTLLFEQGGRVIEPLRLHHLPLVIGYTGIKADTVTIIDRVKAFSEREPQIARQLYTDMGELVFPAKAALQKGDWKTAGKLMDENQQLLERLGVSSPELDKLITVARSAGAYGAKLSGAGGGDCMIALVPEEKRVAVAEAIRTAGGQPIEGSPHAEGVRVE